MMRCFVNMAFYLCKCRSDSGKLPAFSVQKTYLCTHFCERQTERDALLAPAWFQAGVLGGRPNKKTRRTFDICFSSGD
jgi:hypothetical protein